VTQDTSISKDKTGSKAGLSIEITKPVEDSDDNSPQQADANARESLENDFDVVLSEDKLWDEGDHPVDIRLFEDNSYDESDEKELTLSTEEAIPPGKASESRSQETAEAKLPDEASWIVWTIAGVSGILLTVGLVFLWNLSAPFFEPHSAVIEDIPDTLANHGDFETMDLDPFLMPAQRNKEMIFFKLQVELILSDAETKHAIRKKEPWVRDIIYEELKGIDISSGIQKNFLMQYRQPIVRCLNHELAPLRVEDIRLKGYLMK
jgi:flagellar basal body-associated protein FliL